MLTKVLSSNGLLNLDTAPPGFEGQSGIVGEIVMLSAALVILLFDASPVTSRRWLHRACLQICSSRASCYGMAINC